MKWKNVFSLNEEKEKHEEIDMDIQEENTQCQETVEEDVTDQQANVIFEKIFSFLGKEYDSLSKVMKVLYQNQQELLKTQEEIGGKVKVLQEEIIKVSEMQEQTIQKQHNAALKFQEDVIYKVQKNLIMELIGISDNIRMIVQNKENDIDFDLLEEVKKLGQWVDASLSNNSVRKYQDTDMDNTVFNRKRQELVDKEETDDEVKDGTYKTIVPGYIWNVPYIVVNSEVQLRKILDENETPQMFSFVIRPEEIVKLVYKK